MNFEVADFLGRLTGDATPDGLCGVPVRGLNGGNMEVWTKSPTVPVFDGDEKVGFEGDRETRPGDGVGLPATQNDPKRFERFAGEQAGDFFAVHTPILASRRTGSQGIASAAYRPPEQWDASDRAAVEATLGLREPWTPRPARTVDGVPPGWTATAWVKRLTYLADVCEEIRADLAAGHRAEAQRITEVLKNGPF